MAVSFVILLVTPTNSFYLQNPLFILPLAPNSFNYKANIWTPLAKKLQSVNNLYTLIIKQTYLVNGLYMMHKASIPKKAKADW